MADQETSSPFDGGAAMYQADWSAEWVQALSDGILGPRVPVGGPTTLGLKVFSDNDGRQVKVTVGGAHIQGRIYRLNSTKVVPLAVNTTGQQRTDRIVLRLDTAAKKVTVEAKTGTASAPALTQVTGGVWEIPLARIVVPSPFNSIPVSGNITDERVWAAPKGSEQWFDYTVSIRPSSTSGTVGWAITAILANGGNRARYQIIGSTCKVSVRQQVNMTGGAGIDYVLTLPFPAKYERVKGEAMVQTADGYCLTVPNSQAIGVVDNTVGSVVMRKHDLSALTLSSPGFPDTFDIEYELL